MCMGEGIGVIDSIFARMPMTCLFDHVPYVAAAGGSRDRIVVSTLRCGRNNPGSNPGHGTFFFLTLSLLLPIFTL